MNLNAAVDQARKTITHRARAMGYLVTQTTDVGIVTLTMFWLGRTNPHCHLIQNVPPGTPEDPSFRERVIYSGLAIPDRIYPRETQRVLDLLAELERSIA